MIGMALTLSYFTPLEALVFTIRFECAANISHDFAGSTNFRRTLSHGLDALRAFYESVKLVDVDRILVVP
jgi:hypothetical protein